MAEPPPPPLPQRPPLLPQPPSLLLQPPPPQISVPLGLSPIASLADARLMAEPPPAFRASLLDVPVAAPPHAILSAGSSHVGGQLEAPSSPPGQIAQNPRIGDSGKVECGAAASISKAEEDGVADDGSTSLSAICARSKIISTAPDSPAMSTRSKKRAAPNTQPMATRSKKKLKL